jgi:dihydroneopterin aldolase
MTKLFARTRSPAEADLLTAAGFDGTLLCDGDRVVLSEFRGPAVPITRFLDALPDAAALEAAGGAAGVLLDSASRLLDWAGLAALETARRHCRDRQIPCGFSGGLEAADLPRLLACAPDFLVLGRALRVGGRSDAPLDPKTARLLRDLVPVEGNSPAAPPGAPAQRPDRIFVRDFVLPVGIGAYQSEHGRLQKVRFAVEADLAATGRPARDLRDVVSYDLFTDAIRTLTAGRHVELAETLAEEIAARVLDHRRIMAVRVTVEKLEVGPGVVGVTIERVRSPA